VYHTHILKYFLSWQGLDLGFKKPVFFERHAVGGEYGAGWKAVTEGTVEVS
jgi:hypothetical protein